MLNAYKHGFSNDLPRAGSGVVRIDPIRFLTGCSTRRLNQALAVLSLSLEFLSGSVLMLTRAAFCVALFCVFVSWLFWLSARLSGKTRLQNDL